MLNYGLTLWEGAYDVNIYQNIILGCGNTFYVTNCNIFGTIIEKKIEDQRNTILNSVVIMLGTFEKLAELGGFSIKRNTKKQKKVTPNIRTQAQAKKN